jgi:hypothetical protein
MPFAAAGETPALRRGFYWQLKTGNRELIYEGTRIGKENLR